MFCVPLGLATLGTMAAKLRNLDPRSGPRGKFLEYSGIEEWLHNFTGCVQWFGKLINGRIFAASVSVLKKCVRLISCHRHPFRLVIGMEKCPDVQNLRINNLILGYDLAYRSRQKAPQKPKDKGVVASFGVSKRVKFEDSVDKLAVHDCLGYLNGWAQISLKDPAKCMVRDVHERSDLGDYPGFLDFIADPGHHHIAFNLLSVRDVSRAKARGNECALACD